MGKTLYLLSILSLAFAAQKCRALALSGGGSYGAYEAGAINGIVSTIEPEEYAYDYVTGVSAGSMNGGAFAMFPKGEEEKSAAFM